MWQSTVKGRAEGKEGAVGDQAEEHCVCVLVKLHQTNDFITWKHSHRQLQRPESRLLEGPKFGSHKYVALRRVAITMYSAVVAARNRDEME